MAKGLGVKAGLAVGLLVLATLACSTVTAGLGGGGTSAEAYASGQAAYAAGNVEQALADLDAAIDRDPHLAEAFFMRGQVHYLRGEFDEALADATQAIDLGYAPAAEAYSARADIYRTLGDYTNSGADYGEAEQLDAKYFETYYSDRRHAYSQVIEQQPELAPAFAARGLLDVYLQDYDQALLDYDAAIELGFEPLDSAYRGRAVTYYSLRNYSAALKAYGEAIALQPDQALNYEFRAYVYQRLGEFDKALADYEASIAADPNMAVSHNNRCWFGSLLGHAAEVMDSCEKAVELVPTNPGFRDSRGLARALTGDYAGAMEDFQAYADFQTANGRSDGGRLEWIAQLAAGHNPFDEAQLQAMLNQNIDQSGGTQG